MVSKEGYRRRTLEEILNAKIAMAKELFGETINTEENTALGKFIMICAYDQYHIEELAEQIYYSIFPQTASGISLDRLGWGVGIKRNAETSAMYKVKVTGTAGEKVESGFLVGIDTNYIGEDTDLTFENTQETVIGENGECEITVMCTTAGVIGNVPPSIINRVVNAVSYVDTVQGIGVIEAAAGEESDYDFRTRYEKAINGKGGCNEAAILSALISVPTVKDVFINVNESATEYVGEIPPKAIACYVSGGIGYEQEIGEAIFNKKPVGIGTHGDQSVFVNYGALTDYEVKFSFAESKDIYIKIELVTNEKFETSGNATIKANIETYINALGMGEQLITTALYGYIYKVAGVVSAIVTVSTDGQTYTANNVDVAVNEHCVLNTLTINDTTV